MLLLIGDVFPHRITNRGAHGESGISILPRTRKGAVPDFFVYLIMLLAFRWYRPSGLNHRLMAGSSPGSLPIIVTKEPHPTEIMAHLNKTDEISKKAVEALIAEQSQLTMMAGKSWPEKNWPC